MLWLGRSQYLRVIAHVLDGLPEEACGLLAGEGPASAAGSGDAASAVESGGILETYPCRNAAASARLYEVDPRDHLRADRDAEARGQQIVGVYHSHTHTDAYPSPTDIEQAPDPDWHYVIVSLREPEPVVRSYRIVDGEVSEEPVVVEDE